MSRAPLVACLLGLVAGSGAVAFQERRYHRQQAELDQQIRAAEETIVRLQVIKSQVDLFWAKQTLLQQKVPLIERLQASQPRCPRQILSRSDARTTGGRVDAVVYHGGFVAVVGSMDSKAALQRVEQVLAERGFKIARSGGWGREFGIFATPSAHFCEEAK
jgi:hypothetical protein